MAGAEADADYAEVKDRPCHVSEFDFAGINRTKLAIVERELLPVWQAKTLAEIKDLLLAAHADLAALDIFSVIELTAERGSEPDTCVVRTTVQEKEMLRLHTGTYVQGTQGGVEGSLQLSNALGHAEQLALTAEAGSAQSGTYALSFTQPHPRGRRAVLDVRVQQQGRSCEQFSSFRESTRSGTLTLTSDDGRQALSYDLAWRRLALGAGHSASAAVVSQLGDSLKSALRHVFRTNTFDDPWLPRSGWGMRATTEVAGLGPDSNLLRFVRHHLMAAAAFAVGKECGLTVGLEAGVLMPWSTGSGGWLGWAPRPAPHHTTPISDRFFLGGTGEGTLRGFKLKGVGPTAPRRSPAAKQDAAGTPQPSPRGPTGRDAIGGDLLLSAMAALHFPLNFAAARSMGIHGQVFVNGGSLVGLAQPSGKMLDRWRELSTTLRWAAGLGIVWPMPLGKLELNVCYALSSQPHDRPVPRAGLQFGITPPSW